MYFFGRDISYKLHAGLDGVQLSNLPDQGSSGEAFLFDSRPNRDAAASGAGKIGGAFSLSVSGDANQILNFTIPAIADPDPQGATTYRTYWLGINFIKQTGGDVETVIMPLKLMRIDAQDEAIGVTNGSIIEIIPDITAYLSTTELDGMIASATLDVKDELLTKKIEFGKITKPDQLFQVVLWKAIELAFMSQLLKVGDKWKSRAEWANLRYQQKLEALVLTYDFTGDKVADSEVEYPDVMIGVR